MGQLETLGTLDAVHMQLWPGTVDATASTRQSDELGRASPWVTSRSGQAGTSRPDRAGGSQLGQTVDRLTHWVVLYIVDRFSVALAAAVIVWGLILASYLGGG